MREIAGSFQAIAARSPAGGGGSSPTETEKIVLEKWCYFPEVYKMTKILEDGIENG